MYDFFTWQKIHKPAVHGHEPWMKLKVPPMQSQ